LSCDSTTIDAVDLALRNAGVGLPRSTYLVTTSNSPTAAGDSEQLNRYTPVSAGSGTRLASLHDTVSRVIVTLPGRPPVAGASLGESSRISPLTSVGDPTATGDGETTTLSMTVGFGAEKPSVELG
jgi:hypothetical protein